ncbi:septal ring lytic transglycosylase RlpA family protein [Phormidium sp. CLA17]|uniref:septal ring lytic transglycosylase RlpA family protein n=1 Tax=Leptolyngbya sp. Cla-17 TaxID=2803751 RepID=UPI00149275AD|nr:septal ring lytic transglycosylase RlpA family protein [Leptolyngbya sp. Cla-17]MBM0742122.1 septal ring lytic transglycosylase RlpA family protein [Leptolyngbya sp. Cla-17]
MTQKLFSSLTASLLIATLGVSTSSNAAPVEPSKQGSSADLKPINLKAIPSEIAAETAPSSNKSLSAVPQAREVVKVGEQVTKPELDTIKEVIAKVQPHELSGQKAATLYVRNIPVLTFKGSIKASKDDTKLGTQLKNSSFAPLHTNAQSLNRAKAQSSSLTSLLNSSESLSELDSQELNLSTIDSSSEDDPVWRAAAIAARLNQLYRNGLDADKITVAWGSQADSASAERDRYFIQADTTKIAVIDANTVLPDSTRNLEKDALQATNRLRRLLGDATPLRGVIGKPIAWRNQIVSLGPIQFKLTGFASWYGPGFHGNRSASGEVFNQNAMTAAHRTLPFGTQVMVTNVNNGQSVMVRINDRGPFHGNRIIDLSTAAARVLGVVQSGVALVKLEVVDSRSAAVVGN